MDFGNGLSMAWEKGTLGLFHITVNTQIAIQLMIEQNYFKGRKKLMQ